MTPKSDLFLRGERFRKFDGFWKKYKRSKSAVVGLSVLIVIVGTALIGPIFAPHGPFDIVAKPFIPPNEQYFMGTDNIGRDDFIGFLFGARISLLIGVLATLTQGLIGITIGAVAGYFGGPTDNALMRFTEFFQVIPTFFFAVLVGALFGASIWNIILVIGVLSWPTIARLVRGEFLSLKNREFVVAVKGLGAKNRTIIFREILPNALPPVIVVLSLQIANAILIESTLSFLGLGDPRAFSWGFMLNTAQSYLGLAWWLAAFPGLGILVTVIAFNLVGDGLNDALNPRLREV